MTNLERKERYINALESLKGAPELLTNKQFKELTKMEPDKSIRHETETYVLDDELCEHRGYEKGTTGVRYYYYKEACIEYIKDKLQWIK